MQEGGGGGDVLEDFDRGNDVIAFCMFTARRGEEVLGSCVRVSEPGRRGGGRGRGGSGEEGVKRGVVLRNGDVGASGINAMDCCTQSGQRLSREDLRRQLYTSDVSSLRAIDSPRSVILHRILRPAPSALCTTPALSSSPLASLSLVQQH